MNKSSLLYWHPKIKDLGIPIPKTEKIMLTEQEKKIYYKGGGDCFNLDRLTEVVSEVIAEKFSLPVFLRTDEFSGKHFWKKTCYLDKLENLESHLMEIIVGGKEAGMMGLPIEAMVVREYIEMDSKFNAFYGEMPVNPERRYFIKNGNVECHHPYWIEDAVERETSKDMLPENWKELAGEMNFESEDEVALLSGYSKVIATHFKDYWSVDYCKARNGRWILIDMAEAEKSWHPCDCKYSNMPEVKKKERSDFIFLVEKKS